MAKDTTGEVQCKVTRTDEWPKGILRLYFKHPDNTDFTVNLPHQKDARGYQGEGEPRAVVKGDRITVYFIEGVAQYWK